MNRSQRLLILYTRLLKKQKINKKECVLIKKPANGHKYIKIIQYKNSDRITIKNNFFKYKISSEEVQKWRIYNG